MSDNDHKLINITTTKGGGTPGQAKVTLDLQEARARLASAQGPRYWRSLEELSNAEGFSEMLEREFPNQAASWLDPVGRRGFMKLMGASLALAGLSACTKMPEEEIVPYVKQPEDLIPGKPKYYATAMPFGGAALPVMVESNMYRPTKVEGNPQHPMSMGAADTFAQASILGLYDPDRSQTLSYLGEVRTWGTFLGEMRAPMNAQKGMQGGGLRFLTETSTSPSLAAQIKALVKAYPQAKWYSYDPVNRDAARAAAKAAFGQYVDAHYQLEAADVVLSLDADFLSGGQFPGFVRYSRDFISRRKMEKGVKMNRLYVVESTPSTTGAKADHRLPLRASEIETFARDLADAIAGQSAASPASNGDARSKFLAALARDLQQSRGTSVVIPGEQQSAEVHALAHSINQTLGNAGKTVVYTDPVEVNPTEQTAALRELVDDINARKVNILVILGGNPVYNAPADLNFEEAIRKVQVSVHLSLYHDETSRLAQWHIPEAHYLESWSDARALDGSVSIIQPLIEPLYQGKTAHEVVAAFTDQPGVNSYDLLQTYWKGQAGGGDFDGFWRRSLHDGFIASTALPAKTFSAKAAAPPSGSAAAAANSLEVIFRPDPTIYDGRFNNNGWLQELPKPLTKLTWDNAVLISPALASARKLENRDVVEIEVQGRKVKGAIFVLPGQPEYSITLHLGYGRTKTGRTGANTGFSAYALRTSAAPYFVSGANLTKTGDQYELATTQSHNLIDNNKTSLTGDEAERRDLVRVATLEEFEKNPGFAHEHSEEPSPDLTLYPKYEYTEHKWGMAIDLNSCVGCNACVVACQSENNIPVVGKEQVEVGRAMHWIRIDTYFEGHDLANPSTHFQPLPCMHCENAPCEPVCPVGATVHTTEGLNTMVYNRCVGTRYCANNCPYKVRRFNFLLYSDYETPSLKLMRNPEVTVRSRGVMEKCSYCLQRITAGRIAAEKENRWVRDGEVVTACQQTCPTNAIIFGNMNDPDSKVAKLKGDSRNYSLLADVNTRPRTTYIAGVRNPNPDLAAATAGKES